MLTITSNLFEGIKNNNSDLVRRALTEGAGANARDEHDITALHNCALYDRVEIAALLIEHGADVNAFSHSWTALHHAAHYGNLKLLQLLIANGADIGLPTKYGWLALQESAYRGHAECVKLLFKDGQADLADEKGQSLVYLAVVSNSTGVVDFLISKGANVNTRTSYKNKQTPLHIAAKENYPEIVQCLLDAGADIHATNGQGKTVLDITHEKIKPILLERLRTAQPDSRDVVRSRMATLESGKSEPSKTGRKPQATR